MTKTQMISKLREIAAMDLDELRMFGGDLSITLLEEKLKKPLQTVANARMAELMEMTTVSALAVCSELKFGEL